MYAKLFTVAALVIAVVANPAGDQCNTGSLQCCNSVQSADSEAVQGIAQKDNLLAVALGLAPVDLPVGVTCSPLTVIGIGANSCNAQSVCCQNNNFNGVVALGCTPINVN